ncbi:tetratricopeptide repeat protein [Terasakiella pusilla]|uniref:transglutaminase family protein n=1 Tax=Terasakiella pusilla TaxID=64973 RepID=UPI00048F0AAC|nr:tetratricopeptide repeat protein [Terasakiella pusilla]
MSLPHSLITGFEALSTQSDQDFDYARAFALVSKALRPSAKIEDGLLKLHELAEGLKTDLSADQRLTDKVAVLRAYMVGENDFHGDEDAYDDLDHMNLFSILKTGCGTAMGLGFIYLYCLHHCGLKADVLNFPAHCLIRVEEGPNRIIFDPFAGVLELEAVDLRQFLKVIGGADVELGPQYYQELSPKTVFIRHLNAIKSHFLRCEQTQEALEVLHILILLEADSAAFWRESGLLKARIGQLAQAVADLKQALLHTEDENTKRHTRHIIADLEGALSD